MITSILISGSSGMVGQALLKSLHNQSNIKIFQVRRHASSDPNDYFLSIKSPEQSDILPEGNLVWINLNGAGVADKPWSVKRKEELLQSRVQTTQAIAQVCQEQERQFHTYIGASAVGVYGIEGLKYSFLQEICQAWEQSHLKVNSLHKYIVRIPIVLSSRGGALKKMNLPFRLGLGGPLGSGQQLFPWIHLDDLVGIIQDLALKNHPTEKLELGASQINPFITPFVEPLLSQGEFAQSLAQTLHRPGFMPTPSFVIKLIFGQMGSEALLGSPDITQVKPYSWPYKFSELSQALEDCIRNQN